MSDKVVTEMCPRCKRFVPVETISTTVSTGGDFRSCVICALAFRNKMHGFFPESPFSGEQAKLFFCIAVEHLQLHHEDGVLNPTEQKQYENTRF